MCSSDFPLLAYYKYIAIINIEKPHGENEKIVLSEEVNDSEEEEEILPDRPIQLVRPDSVHHQNLEIVAANVKYLYHINSALAVVAVVGKYHSGKSFLLNQLMNKQRGFGVGPTVRPETMGIWMWGKVRKKNI